MQTLHKLCTQHNVLEVIRDDDYLQTMTDARLTRWIEQHKWHSELTSTSCSFATPIPSFKSDGLHELHLVRFVVVVVIMCNVSFCCFEEVVIFVFSKLWQWWGYLPYQIITIAHTYIKQCIPIFLEKFVVPEIVQLSEENSSMLEQRSEVYRRS